MVSLESDPALLGVGYIIGPRIASVMVGGGLLAALMLTPMIAYFGEGLPGVLPPGQQRISEMSPGAISSQYVRYIGAGAVAAGGILSMLNALPLIFASISGSFGALRVGEESGSRRGRQRVVRSHFPRPRGPIAISPCPLSCWAALAWWPPSPRPT